MKRSDILSCILRGESYDTIMGMGPDPRTKGFIYETIALILTASKHLIPSYEKILRGHLEQPLHEITNLREIFDVPLEQGGNPSDMTLKISGHIVPWSIKYQDDQGNKETDINKLHRIMDSKNVLYKIGIIVKNKTDLTNHKGHMANQMKKRDIEKIDDDGYLLDQTDVKDAFKRFQYLIQEKLSENDDIVDWMTDTYLNCPRVNTRLRLHQELSVQKILRNRTAGSLRHIISHKPRSGKTLTMLCIVEKLIREYGCERILIATPVPATIEQFVEELNKYVEFKGIEYKTQSDLSSLDKKYRGIIFCSTHYFKLGNTGLKRDKLKSLRIDVAVFDEAHYSTPTPKTYVEMIGACENKDMVQIFASGTSRKTEEFYGVPADCIYRWGTNDESLMKGKEFTELAETHGVLFTRIRNKGGYDDDYNKCPYQVILRDSISPDLIQEIEEFNRDKGDDKGYSCWSLLSLERNKRANKSKGTRYLEKFQCESTSAGVRMLQGFLRSIISGDDNTNDIMKQIESIQHDHNSRKSTQADPKLFLIYLPYGRKIGDIGSMQKALTRFLKKEELWTDYHICYTNSGGNSSMSKQGYLDLIKTFMQETRDKGKMGCILLLGNQGSLGISYKDCDVTISLDNGHNIDDAKQRFYRAMMEGDGKTIGINVDLNIQRCWMYQKDILREYRNKSYTPNTLKDLMEYLYRKKIYYFNPCDDHMHLRENRLHYFEEIVEKMRHDIEVDSITDNIICTDTLRDMIEHVEIPDGDINKDIQGLQQECNPGGEDKIAIDIPEDENSVPQEGSKEDSPSEKPDYELYNRTKALYGDLSKTCCLLAVWDRRNPQNEDIPTVVLIHKLKDDPDRYHLIHNRMSVRYGIPDNHINKIFDKYIQSMKSSVNETILDDIIEIYSITAPSNLRESIATHFTPSEGERKQNAEIPTPVTLVDNMLNAIPSHYFQDANPTLEPCCGKGNFLLGIFDKYFSGLSHIEDKIERCRVIIEECIFYADIEPLNVHITTHLLMCHAIASISVDDSAWSDWEKVMKILVFKYNTYVGDTLKMIPSEEWNIDRFAAVITNPPYNKGKASNFYVKFMDKAREKWLQDSGYILYVTPNRFLIPQHRANHSLQKYQVLSIHHTVQDFDVSTDIGYFLAQKVQPGAIIDNTHVTTTFDGDTIQIDINTPTPTANNDLRYKVISDKVMRYPDKIKIYSKKDLLPDKDYVFIARRWIRYSPSKPRGGKHIFDIPDIPGEDGRYMEKHDETLDDVKWFLRRSKLMRFITYNYASTVFVPPFVWSSIPSITNIQCNDTFIYNHFELTDAEITIIEATID